MTTTDGLPAQNQLNRELTFTEIDMVVQDALRRLQGNPDGSLSGLRNSLSSPGRHRFASQHNHVRVQALIGREHLRVFLEFDGAAVHALNVPLSTLMGDIESFSVFENGSDPPEEFMMEINRISLRIADMIKKNMGLKSYNVNPHTHGKQIVDMIV